MARKEIKETEEISAKSADNCASSREQSTSRQTSAAVKEKELAAATAAEKARREAIEESMAALEEKARKLTDSRTAMIHMLKSLDKKGHDLADARDYTDNIIESMIDTLIVIDPDGKIRSINKAFSDLLGYTEAELIGKPVATVFEEEGAPLSGNTELDLCIRLRGYDRRVFVLTIADSCRI